MKLNFFLVVLVMFVSLFSFSQTKTELVIPPIVKNEMLAVFPQAFDIPVTWEMEGLNFKGNIEIMGNPAFAVFNENGKLIRRENKMHVSYLSKSIIRELDSKYPGNEILEVYEVLDSSGTKTYKTTYKFKATTVFRNDGSIVK